MVSPAEPISHSAYGSRRSSNYPQRKATKQKVWLQLRGFYLIVRAAESALFSSQRRALAKQTFAHIAAARLPARPHIYTPTKRERNAVLCCAPRSRFYVPLRDCSPRKVYNKGLSLGT
jgi:hypothetical protein